MPISSTSYINRRFLRPRQPKWELSTLSLLWRTCSSSRLPLRLHQYLPQIHLRPLPCLHLYPHRYLPPGLHLRLRLLLHPRCRCYLQRQLPIELPRKWIMRDMCVCLAVHGAKPVWRRKRQRLSLHRLPRLVPGTCRRCLRSGEPSIPRRTTA